MNHAARPTRARRRAGAIALVAALALGAAACSSEGSDASDGGTSEPAAETTTTTPEATDDAATAVGPGEVASAEPVASTGCGTSEVGSVVEEKQFLDDSERWFLLTTPTEHDGETPIPLVFDFHGLAEGANVHARMTEMAAYGSEEGFAVVMPHGEGDVPRWEVTPDLEQNTDLQFVSELLDQLEAELCIDTSRVYATGLSNGAFMSSVLACTMSDRFVAVAPIAGVIHPEGCEPTRPVPVFAIHGTDDAILLFNGGVGERLNQVLGGADRGELPPAEESGLPEADLEGEGYPANVRAWAETDGCSDAAPSDEDLTETVMLRTYDCPPEGAVEFAVVDGGGHSWPGSEFSQQVANAVGTTDTSIDANELIWAFFQRFAMPQA